METRKQNGLSFFEKALYVISRTDGVEESELGQIEQQMGSVCIDLFIQIKECAMGIRQHQAFAEYVDAHYRESIRLMESAAGLMQPKRRQTKTLEMLIRCLEKFCDCLERDYGKCIDSEARIPFSAQEKILMVLEKRFAATRFRLPNDPLTSLLAGRILKFISAENLDFEVTRRSLDYKLELIRGIENWDWSTDFVYYSAIERFFVYVNFNSKKFINLLLARIEKGLADQKTPRDRLLSLIRYHKVYNQLHRKPELILNPRYHPLDTFVNNWFESEIDYYRQCYSLPTDPAENSSPLIKESLSVRGKLICNLSADQLAIYLRLLDEEKLVEASSLNQVYRTLVPFLSTMKRTNLSTSSVRVKSYHPEQRDKRKVIGALERMIKRVEEY
ncbi:MAG: hypothetical protein ACTHZ7_14550 [Sphingobacterium sp.]